MRPWTGPEIAKVESLLADGLSYAQVAKRIGRSRVSVAGGVRRHIHKIPDTRPSDVRRTASIRKNDKTTPSKGLWNERALTETWAERKARRQS